MKPGRCIAALLALALAACATPPPTTKAPPAAELPAAWSAPVPGVAAGPLPAWWLSFDDAMLTAAVDAARAASPTVAAATARLERARAGRIAAHAALVPRADAVAAAQSARQQPATPRSSSAQIGVQASWEIDLFGGRQAPAAAAGAREASAWAQRHAAAAAVTAEAAGLVIALRSCDLLVQQADADARSRAETARLTALTARAGLSAPADASLAQASAAQGRDQWVAQRAECERLLKSLSELTAWPEDELRRRWQASAPAAVPVPARGVALGLPAQLLSQRPDLIDAAQAVLAAAADVDAATAAERPQLSLAGQLSLATLRTAGASSDGSTWSLGPLQLTLPLFDAGARRANRDAARAEYDAAVAQYHGQLRRALREVEQALVALDSTAARSEDARTAAEGFEAALRATESRHRSGLASQFELEDARRNTTAAQRALILLQQERAIAWVDLARALGGGWLPGETTMAGRP